MKLLLLTIKKIYWELKSNLETRTICQHLLLVIWAIDSIWKWVCIWDVWANPNNGHNLVPNPLQYQNDVRHFARTKRKRKLIQKNKFTVL
jgi:hypothetical protein